MDIDAVAPVLHDAPSAGVEPKEEPRIPKWRLDRELAKKKALRADLEQALRLVERQSELIAALEARNQKLAASLARLVESRRGKENSNGICGSVQTG